jgi:UDP-2,3-diacylglucosamine hydrolase
VKSWFISDLHLKDINERNSQILLRFLLRLNQDPKNNQLFLLGDIFDFWLSNGRAFQNQYQAIIDEIVKLKNNGGNVYYFEGNHDFHIDVFWTKKYGIPVIDDLAYMKIGNFDARLEHGDFINPHDHKYLNYRASVRRPWVETFGHMLPGFFLKWLGETLSAKSRKKSKHYSINNQNEIKQMIRTHGEYAYKEKPFDLIISGHMHVVDDYVFSVNGKSVRSINLGTWLNKPIALMVEGSTIEWIELI